MFWFFFHFWCVWCYYHPHICSVQCTMHRNNNNKKRKIKCFSTVNYTMEMLKYVELLYGCVVTWRLLSSHPYERRFFLVCTIVHVYIICVLYGVITIHTLLSFTGKYLLKITIELYKSNLYKTKQVSNTLFGLHKCL